MKIIIASILIAGAFIAGAIMLKQGRAAQNAPVQDTQVVPADNVSIVDGKQIIEISAKGGYTPEVSVAKAGMPTIIRFTTKGTFDCSLAIRIPTKNVSQILPRSGNTDIDIGSNEEGILQGSCGMGMYAFAVEFKND